MKTLRRDPALFPVRLLVLVPHRDARLPLRAWSASLFASGFSGAWLFPWVAPLAVLSRPFSPAELKELARSLREQSLSGGGKFTCGAPAAAVFPCGPADAGPAACSGTAYAITGGPPAVFGPVLNTGFPQLTPNAEKKIIRRFSPLLIGAALDLDGPRPAGTDGIPPPPPLSFRAAALANMIYRPLPSAAVRDGGVYSYEWKIGALHWLPRCRAGRGNRREASLPAGPKQ